MSSELEQPPQTRPSSSSHTKAHKPSNILTSSSSNLRETLSFFGDDLVRVKDFLHYEANESQEGIHPQQIKFERVPSAEVGVKSSRWRKALIAGLFSSSSSKSKRNVADSSHNDKYLEDEDHYEGDPGAPPFWGVGPKIRAKVSMLTLQLVLHELACFASCVLLGCLAVRLLQGNSTNEHHILTRIYEGTTVLLVVLTVLGFLLRIDTTEPSSLLTSPLLITPTVLITVSTYLTKAWELQREECVEYLGMSEETKKHVHLSQDCHYYEGLNRNKEHDGKIDDVGSFVMKIIPLLSCFNISVYLFVFRNKFYLIDKFKST